MTLIKYIQNVPTWLVHQSTWYNIKKKNKYKINRKREPMPELHLGFHNHPYVTVLAIVFMPITRAAPDSPEYTFRPPPEGPHKSMTFQHGCPHHWKPPGGMYFYNTSKIHCKYKCIYPTRYFIDKVTLD